MRPEAPSILGVKGDLPHTLCIVHSFYTVYSELDSIFTTVVGRLMGYLEWKHLSSLKYEF